MVDGNGEMSVRELMAIIGDEPDVRAALDCRQPPVTSATVSAIKHEIDFMIYSDRGRAAQLAEVAQWAADRLGDDVSLAYADAAHARLLHADALYADADPLYARATDRLRASDRPVDAAALAKQRMEALMLLGRYDEALALGRQARSVLSKRGERRLLAEHETNFGNLYYHLDRHRAALKRYDRAHSIFSDIEDLRALAYIDHNRGAVLFELDRFEEALECYERAARSYRSLGLEVRALQVELAMAYLDFLRGRYHESLNRFHTATEAGASHLNRADTALTHLDLAEVYLHLNALPEAESAARRAAQYFERTQMRREFGNALRVAGAAAAHGGRAEEASRLLADAGRIFDELGHDLQGATVRLDIAESALDGARPEVALEAARQAGSIFARGRLTTRRRQARLLEARALRDLGSYDIALRIARATVRSSRTRSNDVIGYTGHRLIAEILADRGDATRALDSYRKAIASIERLRSRIGVDLYKSTFLEDKVGLYEGAVNLCLAAESPTLIEEALTTLELAKSRSLTDLLATYARECIEGESEARALRERFQQLVDQLAWHTARREREGRDDTGGDGARRGRIRRDREILERESLVEAAFQQLQIADPRFADLQRPHVVASETLREILDEDEALVEFVVAKGVISAIVVTRDRLRAVRNLATVDHVDRLIEGLRFQMEKFAYGREYARREQAHLRHGSDLYLSRLYDALMRPLEPAVEDRNLVFVPHGQLHYAPLHALRDGARYVIEQRDVSYAPSATVYALCTKASPSPSGPMLLCGLADPSIPEIESEVQALHALFPDARVLTGEAATRAAIAKNVIGCNSLHLASHARFRSDNPLLSGLRLADGDLTFYDVFRLRLSVDLVVLSGCHTGMAAVGAGDELHGLMRGFLYAGAPSLITSMWAVDDVATVGFMRHFYSELRSGTSKRKALRTAQLATIQEHPHPYYWAPFILFGRTQ